MYFLFGIINFLETMLKYKFVIVKNNCEGDHWSPYNLIKYCKNVGEIYGNNKKRKY